jgi:cytochrome c5
LIIILFGFPTFAEDFKTNNFIMKKGLFLFIMLAVFSFAMVSCGGEKKADDTKKEVKKEATEETAEVAEISADLAAGEETYNKFCFACHKDGIAGSPKLGDVALWTPRAEKGMATLVKHVTEGYTGDAGIMPPMGTCMDCTEEDFINAIAYILDKADLVAK